MDRKTFEQIAGPHPPIRMRDGRMGFCSHWNDAGVRVDAYRGNDCEEVDVPWERIAVAPPGTIPLVATSPIDNRQRFLEVAAATSASALIELPPAELAAEVAALTEALRYARRETWRQAAPDMVQIDERAVKFYREILTGRVGDHIDLEAEVTFLGVDESLRAALYEGPAWFAFRGLAWRCTNLRYTIADRSVEFSVTLVAVAP